MSYEIKIAAFEGPLDLLLHLITKNKIDLYDIPMAELTRQYMDYINESRSFNVEVAAEFLVMAAKLVQIKSKMLLPKNNALTKLNETEEVETDPRDELVQHLLQYQKFQRLSEKLSAMMAAEEKFVKRQPMKLSRKILPPQNLPVEKLFHAFILATTKDDDLVIPQVLVAHDKFNVQDKMADILSQLEQRDEVQLSECIKSENRNEYVTAFLALLELIKRHNVKAEQLMPFSEIIIKKLRPI